MANLLRFTRLISGRPVSKGNIKPSSPKGGGGGVPTRGGGGLQTVTPTLIGVNSATLDGQMSTNLLSGGAAVGDYVVIMCAFQSASALTFSNVDDGGTGNVWSQLGTIGRAATDTVSLLFVGCPVTVAWSPSTLNMDINMSGSTTRFAVSVWKIAPSAGVSSVFSTGTPVVNNTITTSHAATTVSVLNKQVIFGAAAIATDDVITGDSDTTNGNWSAVDTRLGDEGIEPSTVSLSVQYKVVNADGNQSWTATTGTGRRSVCNTVILQAA